MWGCRSAVFQFFVVSPLDSGVDGLACTGRVYLLFAAVPLPDGSPGACHCGLVNSGDILFANAERGPRAK
ncbi:hypothetical protein KC325_g35 [Hortaea werneckii]|nr:hypothetical protein KC325_g35 [Hortaea werneckii]